MGLFSSPSPNSELTKLRIKDIMTTEVVTLPITTPLREAAHMMIAAHISSLIVTHDRKPVGILTERDFIKKLDMGKKVNESLMIQDLLTRKLVTLEPSAGVILAQSVMKENKFRKIVVTEKEELRGIVTQTDLCRVIARLKGKIFGAPLVSAIMTPKVVTVSPDDKFEKVKKLLAQKDMGSVVVTKGEAILGVFTEFDIVSEYYMNPNRLRSSYISDLMTSPVVCITPDFDVVTANRLMIERNFRRLPIVQDGKLIGIVTQTDIATSLYSFIDQNKAAPTAKPKNYKEPRIITEKRGSVIVLRLK